MSSPAQRGQLHHHAGVATCPENEAKRKMFSFQHESHISEVHPAQAHPTVQHRNCTSLHGGYCLEIWFFRFFKTQETQEEGGAMQAITVRVFDDLMVMFLSRGSSSSHMELNHVTFEYPNAERERNV